MINVVHEIIIHYYYYGAHLLSHRPFFSKQVIYTYFTREGLRGASKTIQTCLCISLCTSWITYNLPTTIYLPTTYINLHVNETFRLRCTL